MRQGGHEFRPALTRGQKGKALDVLDASAVLDAFEGQIRTEILEGFDNLEITVKAVHWRNENRNLSAVDVGGK